MEEHRKQAGARVLQLREARQWTHEDLAHAAGLSVKTVSRFEKGRGEGRRTTIRKLAEALGVGEQDIIGAPPAPLGLAQQSEESEALELLRPRVESKAAVEAALTELAEHVASAVPRAQRAQRQASGR